MDRHGSEQYVVVGEGLLAGAVADGAVAPPEEAESGDATSAAVTADAAAAAPAVTVAAAAAPFRFSRLGPKGGGHQLSESNLARLADAMTRTGVGAAGVPAGFTYLGQFIDHDLTMDRTDVMLGDRVSPAQLLQARSPSLDLDSLYGAGPGDPGSARFYEPDGLHLRVGTTTAIDDLPALEGFDLPRGRGRTMRARRRAVIPDPRNDENLPVAQTHLALIRFHNRVVDTLPTGTSAAQRFAEARDLVTKHYQWMIRTDFLPQICDRRVVTDVFRNGRRAFEVDAAPTDVPTMPIEFSVAAYRLGHSMVRESYSWNRLFDRGSASLDLLFAFSGTSGDLGGNPTLPSNWAVDFRRLYEFGRDGLTVPKAKFNRAKRIDTRLVAPLRNLPTGSFGGPAVPFDDHRANLAFRNLVRGRMVRLATGQQLAASLAGRGIDVTPLTRSQLREGKRGADLDRIPQRQRQALLRDTPLWFYVLREAELGSGKLRGVGARILAETFHRAMEGSTSSIVRDATFAPTLGPDAKTFRMVDLLLFAFEGKKRLLAPLG